ncbi:hypothetical protein GCM10025784_11290 [Citricoccus nitrophenolicus]|jgi:hypothetical protein
MKAATEDLAPLWSCNLVNALAGRGRYLIWSPESDEPSGIFETFGRLVRELFTDRCEHEEDDDERSRIAHLLLSAADAAAALVPVGRWAKMTHARLGRRHADQRPADHVRGHAMVLPRCNAVKFRFSN